MGYFADVLAEPAARLAGTMSYDEFSKALGPGAAGFNYYPQRLADAFGFKGLIEAPTGRQVMLTVPGMHDNGPSSYMGDEIGFSPEFEAVLRQYRYAPAVEGKKNNPAMDIYDQAGNLVHDNWRIGDHTGSMMKFMGTAIPALALGGFGVGALGLAGIGPMAGAGGSGAGAGAGTAGGLIGAGEGAAQLAAYSAANPLTAAQVASTATGLNLGAGAGLAGTLGSTAASTLGSTGLDAFRQGEIADYATDGRLPSSAAVPTGAGGGFDLSSLLGGLGGAKDLASIVSGLYGMNLAGNAREASDPFAKYRAGYGEKLAALEANPGSITTRPGFQAGLETIGRKSAATGYYGSGNMASALSRYSGDFYNQEATRLAGLAGAGQTPGAGQSLGADLASQSLGSIGYGLAPMLERFMRGG